MKLENVEVGMRVVIKKRAFKGGGSMEFVSAYKTVPENRNSTVKSIYNNFIEVEFECDSLSWTVSADEIKPLVPKYYLYDDGFDIFIVKSEGDSSGTVVCILKGDSYPVGEYSDEWDFNDFDECKFEVLK